VAGYVFSVVGMPLLPARQKERLPRSFLEQTNRKGRRNQKNTTKEAPLLLSKKAAVRCSCCNNFLLDTLNETVSYAYFVGLVSAMQLATWVAHTFSVDTSEPCWREEADKAVTAISYNARSSSGCSAASIQGAQSKAARVDDQIRSEGRPETFQGRYNIQTQNR